MNPKLSKDILNALKERDEEIAKVIFSPKPLFTHNSTIPITREMVEDDAYRQYMPKTATRDLAMLAEARHLRQYGYGVSYDDVITPEEKKCLQSMNLWDYNRDWPIRGAGVRQLKRFRTMPNSNEIALRTAPTVTAFVDCRARTDKPDLPFTRVTIQQTYNEAEAVSIPSLANASLVRTVEVVKKRELSLSIEELEAALKAAKAIRREFVRNGKAERRMTLLSDLKQAKATRDEADKEVKRIAKQSW